jgi:hypothetical protein
MKKLFIDVQQPFFQPEGNVFIEQFNPVFFFERFFQVDQVLMPGSLQKMDHMLDGVVFFLAGEMQLLADIDRGIFRYGLPQLPERIARRHLNNKLFTHPPN